MKQMYPDANDKPGLTEWVQHGLQLPNGKILWGASDIQAVRVPGIDKVIYLVGPVQNRGGYNEPLYVENEGHFTQMNEKYLSFLRTQGIIPSDDTIIRRVRRRVFAIVTDTEIL